MVELRSVSGSDERLLGSGGAGGWDGVDDESGEPWGWSDEPDDEEEPYERPRIIRVFSIVLVLFVITGTVGAYVAVVSVGASPQFQVSDVVTAISRTPGGSSSATVRFAISNEADRPGRARCRASLEGARGPAASASTITASVPADGRASRTLRVPIAGPFEGPAAAEVTCVPVRSVQS